MDAFDTVNQFEQAVADYFGAPYAVAVDCCTHAVELCLRYQSVQVTDCPVHTHISIPFTLIKLNLTWQWNHSPWNQYYYFSNSSVVDAAAFWQKDGYVPGTMMCLSFQQNKHLSLGRGGIILLDDLQAQRDLIRLSYDGRDRGSSWFTQPISQVGYHYYMTPETAQLGLDRLPAAQQRPWQNWDSSRYVYLPDFPVFQK